MNLGILDMLEVLKLQKKLWIKVDFKSVMW